MGSNTEKAMNQSAKLIQKLKQRDQSDNFSYRKVGRAITKWGAIEKSPILEKLPFLKGNKYYFAF